MDKLRIGFPVVHTNFGVGTLKKIEGNDALVDFGEGHWFFGIPPIAEGIMLVSVKRLKSHAYHDTRIRLGRIAYNEDYCNIDAFI